MSIGEMAAIVAIVVVVLIVLAAASGGGFGMFGAIANALTRTRLRDRIEEIKLGVVEDERAVAVAAEQRVAQTVPPVPAFCGGREVQVLTNAAGNFRGYSERTFTSADSQLAWAAANPAAAAAAGIVPAAAAPTPAETAARSALTRATRLSPVPAVAEGQVTALASLLMTLGIDLGDDAVDAYLAANPII